MTDFATTHREVAVSQRRTARELRRHASAGWTAKTAQACEEVAALCDRAADAAERSAR